MSPSPSSEPRVVVVGAGHAGVQVADALRGNGHTGPITILGEEHHPPYQRPPLSKEQLAAEEVSDQPLRGRSHFAEHDIELRTGVAATALDRRERAVALSDGGELRYDALVLATGADNRRLDVPGAELGGVHTLRTRTDADSLRAALLEASSVLVLGAGFIGLEFAAVAREQGKAVTVLEAAELPLTRALSPDAASHVAAAHRGAGTELRCGEPVSRLTGENGRVSGAIGASGTHYRADLVLAGIGVAPRVELAERAGLEVADGIVVDENLRTCDPAIYAIGDCANHPNAQAGIRTRLESVQNAMDQARHVASAVLGREGAYRDLPWFWSVQGDVRLQIAGLRMPGDDDVVLGDPADGRFSVCCFRDGRLVAVESVNRPADHVAARRLLPADRLPTPEDLDDPDFSLKGFAREVAAAR
ncbi:FAD-dependent oxidoreductase [Saccharopolyspora halophila]|uniref:FAD-dependent oxidoreductase n=1 Tax=Saccharopolyspora halophila TaxID=405551 RepID=A0ABP5TSX5_9PSEU